MDGLVVERNASYYISGYPLFLLPVLGEHEITSPLTHEQSYILVPGAQGLTTLDDARDTLNFTSLMQTSKDAISKLKGTELDTTEKEEGDIDGPFALAYAVTEDNEDGQAPVYLGRKRIHHRRQCGQHCLRREHGLYSQQPRLADRQGQLRDHSFRCDYKQLPDPDRRRGNGVEHRVYRRAASRRTRSRYRRLCYTEKTSMKKSVRLLLLVAALAVAVGCFLLVSHLFGDEDGEAQSEAETISVYRTDSAEIIGMQFDADGASHAFTFASDEWQDATGADRPLEQSSMDALATVCANWTAKRSSATTLNPSPNTDWTNPSSGSS